MLHRKVLGSSNGKLGIWTIWLSQWTPPHTHFFAASVITSKILRRKISLGYSIKYKTVWCLIGCPE